MTTESQDGTDLNRFDTSDNLDAFEKEFYGKTSTEDVQEETNQEVEEPVNEEAPEGETVETDESGAEDNDGMDEVIEEEAPVEEKPKKKTAADRIKELTAQRYEDKRAADARIADLEKKLTEMSAPKPEAKGVLPDGAPDPLAENDDGSLKYPHGEFDKAYISDLIKFETSRERAAAAAYAEQEAQTKAIETARAEAQTAWLGKIEEAKAEIPDLVEKIQSLDHVVDGVDLKYQQYLVDVIQSLDNGPRVAAYLADNPEMAQKIVSSGASNASIALGRLDGKMAKPPVQEKRVTAAPAAPSKVTRGTSGQFTTKGDTDDLAAFEKEFFRKR